MLRSLAQYFLVALVAFIAYFFLSDFFVYVGDPIYVNSIYGKLKGRIRPVRGGRQIYSFTGIPYAKPPVGDLRFEPPVEHGKWEDDILDATKSIKVCAQYDSLWKQVLGQEDCLQLNVYTPNIDKGKPALPVMVWFHGGHFMYGGSNIYGPDYLLQEDIVLVTVNYRLNSLGFLNTGDSVVTGNQGLKDQVLALKWVQKAIKDFGGDSGSVTIFGCSAGGASVSYHMISPMSKGLFHRGISQSGSGLCPWAFTRNPKSQAKRLAEKLNCTTEALISSKDLVNCLRKKSAKEIVSIHSEISNVFHDIEAVFGPTIEQADATSKGNVFLPDSPTELYKSGQVKALPWIAGVNSEEGCFRSPLIAAYEDKLSELNEKWTQVLPKALLLYNDDPVLSEKIKKYYFGEAKGKKSGDKLAEGNDLAKSGKIGWDDLENLTNMYSDRYFIGCVKDAAVFHAQYAPVHLYYYTYKQAMTFGYMLEITPGRIPMQVELFLGYVKLLVYKHILKWKTSDYGVCHTDEMQSQFLLNPLLNTDVSSPHYAFSRKIVKLWVSFARNGKPDDFDDIGWTPLKFDKKTNATTLPLQYLRLGKAPAMIDEPFTQRLKFWEDLKLPKN